MSAHRATIGKYLWTAGFVVVTACCGAIAWRTGHLRGIQTTSGDHDSSRIFRVAGASMVPTLFGPSQECKCETCQQTHLVSSDVLSALTKNRICSLCGGNLLIGNEIAGQLVQIEPAGELRSSELQSGDLQSGDVVAVLVDGQLRAKRIAGLPRDIVSVRDDRLLINDIRVEDVIVQHAMPAKLPVDNDGQVKRSRWAALRQESWTNSALGTWRKEDDAEESWLVFQPTDPRNNHQRCCVQDDYQFNVGVTRKLNTADRLELSFDVEVSGEAKVSIVFWTTDRIVQTTRDITGKETIVCSFYDCKKTSDRFPVSDQQPIAISISTSATIRHLKVNRFVEYRLRKSDERGKYPLQLGNAECYLLGDNVPLSVDSREMEPTNISDIVGRVKPLVVGRGP